MSMDQYTAEFAARGVDGTQLLGMDSDKLKARSQHGEINIYKKDIQEGRESHYLEMVSHYNERGLHIKQSGTFNR